MATTASVRSFVSVRWAAFRVAGTVGVDPCAGPPYETGGRDVMRLADLAGELVAAAAVDGSVWPIALGAAASIITGLAATVATLRTSTRSTTVRQQQQLAERGDRQYDRLQQQLTLAERERDEAIDRYDTVREKYADLRFRLLASGVNPDTIGREPHASP